MKKLLWLSIAVLIVSLGSVVPAGAHGDDDRSNASLVMFQWGGSIEPHVNHLNRMVGHVRWQLSRYHGDPGVRREFAGIRHDVDRVNAVFRAGHYDRRRLRQEIDGLHARLHQLEVRMHVRSNDYYGWR